MAEQINTETCSICLGDFKQPKILNCQHSFCQICLEDYVDRKSSDGHFPCPLCQFDVTLPEGGVSKLASKSTNDVPRCGFIDGCKNVSSCRCRDCDQYLCRSCRRNHDSLKMCKGHVVVSWDEPGPEGDKPESKHVHDERDLCVCGMDKRVDYLCEVCYKTVCYKCFVSEHNGHKAKDLQDEGVRQQIRDEITSLNDELKLYTNTLGKFFEELKTKKSEQTVTVKELCDQIDIQVQKGIREITNIGENMKEDVKNFYLQDEETANHGFREDNNLRQVSENTKTAMESLKASMNTSMIVLEERSIVQMVERLDQLRQEVKDCRSRKMVFPDVPVMVFEAGEIDRDILSKQVGRLVNRQGMFEVCVNVDEISNDGVRYYSRETECRGLTWCVGVERISNGNVEMILNLTNTSPITMKSCDVDYSIKLVNINNDHQSVMRHGVKTFTPRDLYWPECLDITWRKLTDRKAGFIDENNQFKIQVTLKVQKSF